MKKVFVTGASGFIGSHTVVELLEQNFEVVGADNFSNSKPSVIERVKKITNKEFTFVELDLLNRVQLKEVFDHHDFDAIIHFAGLKSVGDSVQRPQDYYYENLGMINNLLSLKKKNTNIIFSSSATVYDSRKNPPYSEEDPLLPINPYGMTKMLGEMIFSDVSKLNDFKTIALRYFNPIGAHSSGLIGEHPSSFPNNLMPYILDVASGSRPVLNIFGNDYPTRDGTGSRDYIHVVDLAKGHVAALTQLDLMDKPFEVFNLGTGHDTTVQELAQAFCKVNEVNVATEFVERRDGDAAVSFAAVEKSQNILNWKAQLSIEEMCKDAWKWQEYLISNES